MTYSTGTTTMNNVQKITSFTDLDARQKAHKLAINVYKATETLLGAEQLGLINQTRRCAVSKPSNITGGFSRSTRKNKVNFYTIALGPTAELQSQSLPARDLGYITNDMFKSLYFQAIDIHKLVNGLIKSARGKDGTS